MQVRILSSHPNMWDVAQLVEASKISDGDMISDRVKKLKSAPRCARQRILQTLLVRVSFGTNSAATLELWEPHQGKATKVAMI